MDTTTYILDGTLHNHPEWWQGALTGTLEDITYYLIRENEDIRGIDESLTADFFPELYWADPDAWPLDEDEEEPARPDYSEQDILALASHVYDECRRHFTLTPNEE